MPEKTTFQALQEAYGLTEPGQIKMKILWHHIKFLVEAQTDSPESRKLLDRYDRHWRMCEAQEQENERT